MSLHIGSVHAEIDITDPPALQRSAAGAALPGAAHKPPVTPKSDTAGAALTDIERLRPLVLLIIREELERAVRQRS